MDWDLLQIVDSIFAGVTDVYTNTGFISHLGALWQFLAAWLKCWVYCNLFWWYFLNVVLIKQTNRMLLMCLLGTWQERVWSPFISRLLSPWNWSLAAIYSVGISGSSLITGLIFIGGKCVKGTLILKSFHNCTETFPLLMYRNKKFAVYDLIKQLFEMYLVIFTITGGILCSFSNLLHF